MFLELYLSNHHESFTIQIVTDKTFPRLHGFNHQITVSYTSISFFAHFIYETIVRIKAIHRKSRDLTLHVDDACTLYK